MGGIKALTDIIARVKVLPEDVSIKPEEIIRSIKESINGFGSVVRYAIEPIAFGLNAVVIDFRIEDKEGGTDQLEEALTISKGVSQFDIIGVSRASTKL